MLESISRIKFSVGSAFSKGGSKLDVLNLYEIGEKTKNVKNKEDQLAIQMFNCGYRTTKDTIDWSKWNGCVYSDLDIKHFLRAKYVGDDECNVRVEKNEEIGSAIFSSLIEYPCFIGMQDSWSKEGIHLFWHFNVEKNKDNFDKCCQYVKEIVYDTFVKCGLRDVIEYPKVADRCSISEYQFAFYSINTFYENDDFIYDYIFDIENYEKESKKILVSDVDRSGNKFFKYNGKSEGFVVKTRYFEHHQRWQIYEALIAVFNDKSVVDKEWERVCDNILELNGHNRFFYIKEPNKNHWYDRYFNDNGERYVNVGVLGKFGYKVERMFRPVKFDNYNADKTYTLKNSEKLSDIDIEWNKEKINHLFAGCGFGKTYNVKMLGGCVDIFGNNCRVCFISPMKSINKDSFEGVDDWVIIDGDHKEKNIEEFTNIKRILNGDYNICTTWESFVAYKMYDIPFDYVVLDECHTLYMYDYRIKSINNLKKYFPKSQGIKIMMTGTPCYEITEFDCHKIKIKKDVDKVKCDIWCYEKDYKGLYIEDMTEWVKGKNHYALVFYDLVNHKYDDFLKNCGVEDVFIFNRNYEDNVNVILNENTIKNKVTAFSVYGQCGINLNIDVDKKIRIYILCKNSLGVIQYSNRVRNKGVIDKIIIPYKQENIVNDIPYIDDTIDYGEAKERVDKLNSVNVNAISIGKKDLIFKRFGLNIDCLDIVDGVYSLNRDLYKTYKMIQNVNNYEKEIQVLWNTLKDNGYDVFVTEKEDKRLQKDKNLRSNQFAGAMVRVNMGKFDRVSYEIEKDGIFSEVNKWVLKDSDKTLNKVIGDDIKKCIEFIFNTLYDRLGSIGDVNEKWDGFCKNILGKYGTITKRNIEDIGYYFELEKDFSKYYNNKFIELMLSGKYDEYKLTALYVRSVWNENIEDDRWWNMLCDEILPKMKRIMNIVIDNKDVFGTKKIKDMVLNYDDITRKIYLYLVKTYNAKVNIDGVDYGNMKEYEKRMAFDRYVGKNGGVNGLRSYDQSLYRYAKKKRWL